MGSHRAERSGEAIARRTSNSQFGEPQGRAGSHQSGWSRGGNLVEPSPGALATHWLACQGVAPGPNSINLQKLANVEPSKDWMALSGALQRAMQVRPMGRTRTSFLALVNGSNLKLEPALADLLKGFEEQPEPTELVPADPGADDDTLAHADVLHDYALRRR